VDWSNLRHHACSEVGSEPFYMRVFKNTVCFFKIRANGLSGDCSWGREIQRGTLSFSKQYQVRAREVVAFTYLG